jgi:hypothetical protein
MEKILNFTPSTINKGTCNTRQVLKYWRLQFHIFTPCWDPFTKYHKWLLSWMYPAVGKGSVAGLGCCARYLLLDLFSVVNLMALDITVT